MANKVYKFRMYPTKDQEQKLLTQLETLRRVYNNSLDYWKTIYKLQNRSPKANELFKIYCSGDEFKDKNGEKIEIASVRSTNNYLKNVGSVSIRDTIDTVKVAFDNFFRRVKNGEKPGYPRDKQRNQLRSIPFNNLSGIGLIWNGKNYVRKIKNITVIQTIYTARNYRLRLFGVGDVKLVCHRVTEGVIKSARVVRENDGKWYCCFIATIEDKSIPQKEGKAIGIDIGVTNFVTTSDGEYFPKLEPLKKNLLKLRRNQRKLCRKRLVAKKENRKLYECKNYQKNKHDVARIYSKVKNIRKDQHYKVAGELTNKVATICAENLTVKNMVKNRNLARSILDCGWAAFLGILNRKAENAGVKFVKVNPQYTSQICSNCGHCESGNRKTQSEFICIKCKHTENADTNAAKNILKRGLNPPSAGHSDVSSQKPRKTSRKTSNGNAGINFLYQCFD